ncbi:Alginate biosynthesis transcriptional regulatory protein AlgB [Fundidesulfovibrio magnetotacticus]|uniref:Alginate biosynthesis transcriptional regulatory protein AlgB n=1 Tax=Fundidesulfovibrio magnetotacticus TaxID=2730080 RepID=A0A6V8LWN8_9BACT|nr:response regulator [Fundidesulfovibrio magnetotacticus]GFK94077.1 Alginate biosynthesis transcriptional regulatory protein AlgB [Fundidesulfovibrio magnetotacticus]
MNTPVRLLCVDDEERFVTTLAKLLTLRNMQVTTALSGEDALERFQPGLFDVALLDVKMPGISGVELLTELKRRDPDLEIIILTGHASVDIAADIMSRGGADYLLKPCPTADVEAKIISAMERRAARAG